MKLQKALYVTIPADIFYHKKLSQTAKMLYGAILNLSNNDLKYCWASNGYLGKELNLGITAIKTNLKQLKDFGIIEIKRVIKDDNREERQVYPLVAFPTAPPVAFQSEPQSEKRPQITIRENTNTTSEASPQVGKPNRNDINAIIKRYYQVRGITNEGMRRDQWGRCYKVAQKIFLFSNNNIKKSIHIINKAPEYFEEQKWNNWKLETIKEWYQAIEKFDANGGMRML